MKRVVLALGGNALGNTPSEQLELVKTTANAIVDLVQNGVEVVIGHGNGPQVGMINLAFDEATKLNNKIPTMPLPECGAFSQGYIGYHLQQAIKNEYQKRKLQNEVSTIITQVEVDAKDPSFKNPTKPIGSFYSKEEASKLVKTQNWTMKEDAGRGYRRVVASPKPIDIVEKNILNTLLDKKHTVITVGGGGIPVIKTNVGYKGIPSVIDKDFACEKLAELVNADTLLILTAVDYVSINYGKPNQEDLKKIKVDKLKEYVKQNHFASGSMLPKVEAAIEFASSKKGRTAIITDLKNAKDVIKGVMGTFITK